MNGQLPQVVIVGGGFGGLAAAKSLRKTPVNILLIDRNNHHVFQPLLYQVATSVLMPEEIAAPIRSIVRKQRNTTVILGEVTGVDRDKSCVLVSSADRTNVPIHYDYLILATGAGPSYFGHDEFARYAPGLKTLADAVAIQNKIVQAFEQAEAEEDPTRHKDLLTFVLVGAGPTGVEMAGAIAVLVRTTLRSEYRRIDPAAARIVLVDRGQRVLGTFSEYLSNKAKQRLEKLGVEVHLASGVDRVDPDGVVVAGQKIASKTVIWTAGVAPSPAAKWLGALADRAGRACVGDDLSVPNLPTVFVIGDTAAREQDGRQLPGVAQVAMQQGRYVGKLIHNRITGKAAPRPFHYFDKGNMAIVGKRFAILQSGKLQMSGFIAWLAWALIHIRYLAQRNLRASVLLQWLWTFFSNSPGSRLIVDHQARSGQRYVPSADNRSGTPNPDASRQAV